MKTSIKLPFGLNKLNKLVHITDVQSGKKCECTCPGCRAPLIAAKGTMLQHHFKHDVSKECEGGLESAIHMAAKRILIERRQITLPEYIAKVERQDSKGLMYFEQQTVVHEGVVIDFESVNEEIVLNEMKVDILATKGQVPLIIEICYSHKVDDEKIKKIISKNLSAIEINISDLNAADVNDWESFWKSINDPQRIKWLYNSRASGSTLKNLESKLEARIQSQEKKYKIEEVERNRKLQLKENERKKKEEREKSDLLKALSELKFLCSDENKEALKKEAEENQLWSFNNEVVSSTGFPHYLRVDVPFGDWIFSCDKSVWQIAFYKFFISSSEKSSFSVKDVHDWLKLNTKCRVPRAAVIVGIHGKNYSSLVSGLPDGLPSPWRTLRAYFDYLCRFGILMSFEDDSGYKRSFRYKVISKTPFGNQHT